MRERLLQGFWLGDLRIEPASGSVQDGGDVRHLPSRAIEVLLCLARKPGELVSRAELLDIVWGKGGGSDEALSHAVSELRHGLDDHADNPQFVQTLPRRGYRLLLEPRLDAPPANEPSIPVKETSTPTFWRELMQRGVVQAGAAHLVVGWLLIQVAGETFDNLGLPPWSVPFVTFVVVAGFPVVLVLAWFLEFAEGRMTIDRGQHRRRAARGGLERNYLAVLAAYAAAGLMVGGYHAVVGIPVPATSGAPLRLDAEAELPVEPDSIAVMRFTNIGGGAEARIFSDGLAEDVLDRLARVPGLSVASRVDAWSLPETADSGEVRKRLRVAHFLQGSVRIEDGVLRVVVRLIDSETGFHRFARTFERDLVNLMEVQREITELTVASLRIAINTDVYVLHAGLDENADLDAYVLYRRGHEILQEPHSTASLGEAISYFTQALERDPDYAAAHAGLCAGFVATYQLSRAVEFMTVAEQSCARALSANPNLGMVYAALGDLYRETNRLEQAEAAYHSALLRNGNDVRSMLGMADVHYRQNDIDAAEMQLQKARRAQPGNWRVINESGILYFSTGRFADAAAAFRDVVFLDPENWQVLGNMGSALLMAGSFQEAATVLEQALDIHADQSNLSNLAIVHYYLGEFDEAVTLYREAVRLSPGSSVIWTNYADALHFAGDDEASQAAFRRAADLAAEQLRVNSADTEALEALAWSSAMLGDGARARQLIGRAVAIEPTDPYVYYYDALIRHREGDVSGALDAIETAIKSGYPKAMLQAEPYLRGLQDLQRFAALMVQAGN